MLHGTACKAKCFSPVNVVLQNTQFINTVKLNRIENIGPIEAIQELKVKYKDYIDIQIATAITDESIIRPAIEKGWINVIGAYAQHGWNSLENGDVDRAFNLAKKYNLLSCNMYLK